MIRARGRARPARSIVEHLTAIELLPAGSRRFSVPVSPCNAAFALVAAAADAGNASEAAGRAIRVLAHRRYIPGEAPGPTVLEAITAEIEAARDDPFCMFLVLQKTPLSP